MQAAAAGGRGTAAPASSAVIPASTPRRRSGRTNQRARLSNRAGSMDTPPWLAGRGRQQRAQRPTGLPESRESGGGGQAPGRRRVPSSIGILLGAAYT